MVRKFATLALMTSGFTMALGLNCLPNIGTSFQGILDNFGLGDLFGGILG
ncbi:MAG: hypothetical protein IT450_19215 [Phycisphaerales bacterium]|nr:hypothetical protein [Phycisphaerales bacterium]